MRTLVESVPDHVLALIQNLRVRLCDPEFSARHRVRPEDFTRHRQLTFPVVMLFVLQKTVKSIQRHLHEFFNDLAGKEIFASVSPGAWTHARAKLGPAAFTELNREVLLPLVYGPERQSELRRWRGHRLLGVDSSLLRLPNSAELLKEFSPVEVSNQSGLTGTSYPEGRMSVLFDLLNRVGLDGRLDPSSVSEVQQAIEQMSSALAGDVLISDRGFSGYCYLAWQQKLGLNYVARCSTASFAAAQELFRMNRAGRSVTVRLLPSSEQKAQAQALGLPLELIVRFVSLRLSTGELEVLATSLLDEQAYPTEEFLEVYDCRWNHETYYGTLKGRLDLENFSGKTVEAIRQDFHAALLLSNFETVLTEPAAEALREGSTAHQHRKQVNHAIAFHAIKDRLIELLYSQKPALEVMLEMQQLFLASPTSVRRERRIPRRKPSLARGYHFQRRQKKVVF